jgi:exosortase
MHSRTTFFLLWVAVVVTLSWGVLREIVNASRENGYSSHVVLFPFITTYFIWSRRKTIFPKASYRKGTGALVAVIGILGFVALANYSPFAHAQTLVTAKLIAVFAMIIGGFIGFYGAHAFQAALFPFALLLLMLPLPSILIEKVVYFLQKGSADLAYGLFSILGIPVYREGFLLRLPGLTIEVAKECSGINSSVALLITMLLVAFETLQTTSRRVIIVLLTIPLSLVKNAIRIVTLTMLAMRVDPSFLTGRLHHQGGFVFFLLALAIMYPVWKLLQKTEQKTGSRTISQPPALRHASGVSEP